MSQASHQQKCVILMGKIFSEVAIVGGGPTGCIAARLFAEAGFSVALVAPVPARSDDRTTALLRSSWRIIEALSLDARIGAAAQPLRAIRLIDATGSVVRAPEVLFRSAEIGLDAFGYNVPNTQLLAALLPDMAGIVRIDAPCEAIDFSASHCRLKTKEAVIGAELVVGADGANSLVRKAAGIGVRERGYDQTALVATLTHTLSHEDTASEFHTSAGPFTLVPVARRKSAVVCVSKKAQAEHLRGRDAAGVIREWERRSHMILGPITHSSPLTQFSLRASMAQRMIGARTALVGEAAHVLAPIGAQGLNLGLRDVATLVEIVAAARQRKNDIGAPSVLQHYAQARWADVHTRGFGVDMLNRSLLGGFLPLHGLRALGLATLGAVPALRRLVMHAGLEPAQGALPKIMRADRTGAVEVCNLNS